MAIKLDTFSSAGGGAGTDNLDDVTSRGATTTNAITVGGVSVGTAYTLPTVDGGSNTFLKTDGAGNLSFSAVDVTGGLVYQGAFNATTGLPSIDNAEKGDFYVIDTAGTIYGQTWAVGDHLLINEDMGGSVTNSKIDKIDNTDQVTSVNGNTGVVVLSGDDLAADHTATNYTAANANIDGHFSGIDTALGAVVNPTLDDVTTNGNTTTNDIAVGQVTVSGDILANANATHTIGAEATRFVSYYGDMNGAIRFKARNNNGTAITKGQAVFISGVDGTVPQVQLAQANSAATMPAFGLALTNANDQAEVQIISFGNLTSYNTTTYSLSLGDTVYVSAASAGALTNTAPTSETNLIQNIGKVIRAHGSDGIIKVGGAGRSAATPNLNQDKIFLGNASNQAVSTALSSVALSSFNDDLSYLSSGDNITELTNNAGYLANINSESIGDLSDVTITAAAANEVLKYNGSAWVDANVDYSEVTNTPTNVSTFTNDAGYLTNINSESIDDLSDVVITTATTGQVLSYNGTNWVNGAASSGSLAGLSDVTITAAATNEVLKYNGSVWVESNVDYSEVTNTPTNVSTFTNDAGYLTAITSESIGDLTDVTIKAAASGEYLRYNGSAWVDASLAVVDDATPSLGGNLDTNGNELVTASNANLVLRPNGTGHVFLGGNTNPAELRLYCESADAHYVGLKSPAHSELSGSQTWRLPVADGTSGQAVTTDGSGNLSFTTISGGGGGWTYSAITADPANAQANYHYSCTGTFTVTLPTSGVSAGSEIRIKNMGSGTITVDPQTQNIDGSTTDYTLDVQYSAITLVSTGTHWEII